MSLPHAETLDPVGPQISGNKFVVLKDYGTEGWQFIGVAATICGAVRQREESLLNSGGTVIICEFIPILTAYRMAEYEKRD